MLLQYCSLHSNPVVTLQRQLDPEYTDFGTVRVNSMECQLVNLFSTLEDKVCSIISKNIPSVTKVLSVIGSFKQLSVQFSSVQFSPFERLGRQGTRRTIQQRSSSKQLCHQLLSAGTTVIRPIVAYLWSKSFPVIVIFLPDFYPRNWKKLITAVAAVN